MQSESEIQQRIQIEAAKRDCRLLRNNSGELQGHDGRPVRFGLGNVSKAINDNSKSSDLIGITTVTVTPEMVGKKLGIFTAVEVKAGDWKPSATDKRERAQRNFIDWVRTRGGIGIMSNSVDEVVDLLKT